MGESYLNTLKEYSYPDLETLLVNLKDQPCRDPTCLIFQSHGELTLSDHRKEGLALCLLSMRANWLV